MQTPDPTLVQAVQTNCHIADAAHAADMTLCIYLLQMREFFRWEQGLGPLQAMPRESVGAWLSAREALWDKLEDTPLLSLPLPGGSADPFDVQAVNEALAPQGLVYGAGYTAPGRPSFFLGELESVQQREGVLVRVSGREYARGLSSPPAALQDGTIYLRRESLQRWLWEKYEAWTLRRPAGAFQAALDAYGHADDAEQAVPRMAQAQAESLLLHELGEARVAAVLGPDWSEMRSALQCRRTELHVRAVRDLLADCLVTLPTLLERQADASVHFWFANFEGLRAVLCPLLQRGYEGYCAGDGGHALWEALHAAEDHWQQVCQRVLALHRAHGPAAQPHILKMLESAAVKLA
jgi:hypothetical protein